MSESQDQVGSEDTGISPVLLQAISTIQSPTNTSVSFSTPDNKEESMVASEEQLVEEVITEEGETLIMAHDSQDGIIVTEEGDNNIIMVSKDELQDQEKVTIIKVQNSDGSISHIHVPESQNVADIVAAIQQSNNPDSSQQNIIIYTNDDGSEEQVVYQQGNGEQMTIGNTETVGDEIVLGVDGSKRGIDSNIVEVYPKATMMNISILDAAQQELAALKAQESITEACPICGDRVTGFHYGIGTCESCKGFFKRTVQNKKEFVCHRGKECDVNLITRKKCPACRYNKCLEVGMKLEAIREDRARGGRSPFYGTYTRSPNTPKQTTYRKMSASPSANSPSLLAILKKPFRKDNCELGIVPLILENLINLEEIFNSEDIPQPKCCEDIFPENEVTLKALLHLADHRLYKVVRWSRNLSGFNKIRLDDQILLLQNCWCHLLLLYLSWKSMDHPGEIRISSNKSITLEIANKHELGEVAEMIIQLMDHFRRIHIDSYEFAALKVLVLINPDVKGLISKSEVHLLQEEYSNALMKYTSSHYPQFDNKFGDLLLRLSEVEKVAGIGREQIIDCQLAGDVPSSGLVAEMIKGDQEKNKEVTDTSS